ncbi:hypothetical protein [Membranihabitans maritimus]|nr:hypothetical protein [Membranihabitans maritimus]
MDFVQIPMRICFMLWDYVRERGDFGSLSNPKVDKTKTVSIDPV